MGTPRPTCVRVPQLAVAQGFGGPQSPEKAAWLVGAVLEFLSQNRECGGEGQWRALGGG